MTNALRRKPNTNSKLENLAQIDKLAQSVLDGLLNNDELIQFATRHVLQRMGHNPDNTVVCSPDDVKDFPGKEHILDTTDEEQIFYGLLTDVNNMVLQRALFLNSQHILSPPAPSVTMYEGQEEIPYEEFEPKDIEDQGH
jgi:hypothetical protein